MGQPEAKGQARRRVLVKQAESAGGWAGCGLDGQTRDIPATEEKQVGRTHRTMAARGRQPATVDSHLSQGLSVPSPEL